MPTSAVSAPEKAVIEIAPLLFARAPAVRAFVIRMCAKRQVSTDEDVPTRLG